MGLANAVATSAYLLRYESANMKPHAVNPKNQHASTLQTNKRQAHVTRTKKRDWKPPEEASRGAGLAVLQAAACVPRHRWPASPASTQNRFPEPNAEPIQKTATAAEAPRGASKRHRLRISARGACCGLTCVQAVPDAAK